VGSVEWQTVISTVVGVIVGGLINWWFSRRALKQLVREAAWLRQITNLILRAMKEAGLASFNRNPETGEAEGLVINLSGVPPGRSSASANPAVGREVAPDKNL
jgi:membrane protein YqaA with SNARE-associated domain